jgi:peptidase E
MINGMSFQILSKKELFKGKIIAGESAGTYALSSWFHSEKAGGTFEGLGIVPVKTICHYTEERKDFLKDCSNDLEEVVLPDYSYKVFEY